MPCNLSIPLGNTTKAMSQNGGSCAASNSNVYTDPMAAFSVDKKKNTDGVSNCYVFKSRLQEYAQKVGQPTPVYETIKEGPSHEPSFRSTVIVNNVRYNSLPGFFNRKAAEQSAAEVALMELAKSVDMDACISQPVHETGLCKNLLQEYAQKMNYAIPLYNCQKVEVSGRVPHFSCTVEIGGIRYIGAVARTKKEAEIKAARTALLAIQSSTSESFDKSIGDKQLTVIPCKKRGAETSVTQQENASVPKTKKARYKKMKLKKKLSAKKVFQPQFQNPKMVLNTNTDQESKCEPDASVLGCQQLTMEPTTNPHEAKGQVEQAESVAEGASVLGCQQLTMEPTTKPHEAKGQVERAESVAEGASVLSCQQLTMEPTTKPHEAKGQVERVESVAEGASVTVPNVDGNSATGQPMALDVNAGNDRIVTMACGDATLCSEKANEVAGFGDVVMPVNSSAVDQLKASSTVGPNQVG